MMFGKERLKEENRMMLKRASMGQGLIEYALIITLVAITVLVVVSLLGPEIGKIFSDIMTAVP